MNSQARVKNAGGLSKLRNLRLRNLAAEEFCASVFANLRSARKLHPGAFAYLWDFHTAPEKLRSPCRLWSLKVRNVISDFLAPIFWTPLP